MPEHICPTHEPPEFCIDVAHESIQPLLLAAHELINGARRKDYGSAEESFNRIAAMWSAYLRTEISGKDVCSLMILLKVCRGHQYDSFLDIAGYAGLSEVINES